MITRVEGHIHYKFEPQETARLIRALEPFADDLRRVTSPATIRELHSILRGGYFRRWQLKVIHGVLVKTAKFSRQNVSDFFAILREDRMGAIEELEGATDAFWQNFEYVAAATLATD